MAAVKDAFELYEILKSNAIEKSATDEKVLAELLNTMLYELKTTKRSDFLDSLYTACLHYAFLPHKNKRTYPEVRIKPVSMGISGTDAMLLIQLLDMRAESENCAEKDEYKALAGKLFTSYVMKPSKVNKQLGRTFRHMNTILCQQGALAHFGSEEQKAKYTTSVDARTNAAMAKAVSVNVQDAVSTDDAKEKAVKIMEAVKAQCAEMIAKAQDEADGIVERARSRERIMAQERNAAIERNLAELLSAVTESNKTAVALQTSINETYPARIAKDIIELYDVIADTRRSASDEKMQKNLASFLDMIEDTLIKYGVESIKTGEGKEFDGKLHEATSQNFNPKAAFVSESIRTGFRTKDGIIRKEQVAVKNK